MGITYGRRMGWALCFAGLILFFISIIAWGTCTTPWHSPSGNSGSWTNGSGGYTAGDSSRASETYNGDEHEYDSYGFSGDIPLTATIVGFEVQILGYSVGGGSVSVGLSPDGGTTVDMQSGTVPWKITLPIGSSNEAWGSVAIDNPPFIHTFTPAEVCANAFTVWVKANVAGTAIYVDAVEVRVVYYDEIIFPWNPNNPTSVSSTTHSTGVWYNASTLPPEGTTVTLGWNSATDRPTCDSGIDGYRIYWDANTSTNLGASDGYFVDESGAHTQDFALGSGQRWFHIRSVDNVGNLADSTAHNGPYQYDDTWPTNPNVTTSRATGTWLNLADVPISVSGASDTPSGVDGFETAWTHSASWTHTATKNKEEGWTGETFTLPNDGVWYFQLATVDNAGNWRPVYETEGWFGVDMHAPTDPTVTSPTHAEGSVSSNPNVQIAVSGATDPQYGESGYENSSGVDGFSVVWDHSATGVPDVAKDHEQDWTGTTDTLADGTWYFHLRTTDNAGNWTSTEDYGPVTIDTTPPEVSSIVRADANPTNASSVNFTVTFSEDATGVDIGDFSIDASGVTGASITSVSGSGATRTVTVNTGSGSGTLSIDLIDDDSIIDDAGNPLGGSGIGNYSNGEAYTIDRADPVSSISSGPDDPSNVANPSFTFSASDTGGSGVAKMECRLTGTATRDWTQCASDGGPVTNVLSGLFAGYTLPTDGSVDGSITFEVRATDAVGNIESTATWTWTYDSQPPSKPVTPDLDATSDNGHWDNDDITNDNTPTFSGAASAAEGNSTVDLYRDGGIFLGTTTAAGDGSWSITSTVIPEGTYNITITATDGVGNVSPASDPLSVLIDTQDPNDPGNRVPVDNAWIDTTSPTFEWTAPSDPGGSGIYNYRVQIWGPATRNTYTTNLSYNPSLGVEGTYTWRLYAIDLAGNNGDAGASTWTLNIDATDPAITNVLITNDSITTNDYVKNTDDVTITATVTDTNLHNGDTAYIEADLTGLGGGTAVNPDTYVGTTATWALANVTCTPADGTVTVTVDAEDRAGNAAPQGSDTITSDNTNPVITNVLITNNSITTNDYVKNMDDVTITATVTDTNLLDGDMAYITADLTGLGSGTAVNPDTYDGATATWTLTSVTCNPADGTVTVTVDAEDRAGNAATQGSDTIISDNTNPVITNVLITNNSITTNDYVKNMDDVTITATVTDTNLLDGDMAYITTDLTGLGSGTAVNPDTYIGTMATWTLTGVTCTPADGTVTVTVDAEDRAGNAATQGSDTIISDNTNPVITNVLITNTTVLTTTCIKDSDGVAITVMVTDTNLLDGDMAYITADLTGLGSGTAVNPDTYIGTMAIWTLTGVTCTPADGTVTVTVDAKDRAGNEAAQGSDTITADNTEPTIDSITSTTANGCYGQDSVINVTINFSEDVMLSGGNMTVNLDSGGLVTITPFTSRDWASGTYTVLTGHNDCDLSVTSLVLDGNATLRDCPWNETDLTLPAGDNLGDNKNLIVDTTVPLISGVDVQPGIWLSNEDVSADCCFVTLDFKAQITDNCSIPFSNINVTWDYGASSPPAVVENLTWWRESGQTDVNVVDIIGTIDVRCLTGCPTLVLLTVTAIDCAGNVATPLVSDEGTMGRVNDIDAPEPKDDPNGDEDRNGSDNLEVRSDGNGQYRLMVRENTPVRIDVVYNDDDNCSSCTCCGTMWIHDIVDSPEYGTVMIEVDHGDCNGGSSIRYAPYHSYIGPDEFTYRIKDACGNVSAIAKVYLEVVRQTVMNDIYLTTCVDGPVSFDVKTTDLWVEPEDPGEIPFVFSIFTPPIHGVVSGDLGDVTYEVHGTTTKEIESATITLVYTPAAGFTGRDVLTLRFADPFGGSSTAVVDIAVIECEGQPGEMTPFVVPHGEIFPLIVPLTFAVVYEKEWHTVTVQAIDATGTLYNEALSATWEESIGRYVLRLDTASLPPGLYQMTIPLGNGETVTLMIEVGEAI